MTQGADLMVDITIDIEKCSGCGLCVEICPNEVLDWQQINGKRFPGPVSTQDCSACMTCSGKCPEKAIAIHQPPPLKRYIDDENKTPFEPLPSEKKEVYQTYTQRLENILKLRWKPVAITLIKQGAPLPHVPVPRERLRYCQSLIMARRGLSMLMPMESHACPDGASILGLAKVPPKLASGEIYVQLGKLATQEAAAQMVKERPMLPERSVRATLVTPLDNPVMEPDVIAIIAPPETMMWLCMSSTYYTGTRKLFHMSSYNAQCVETTLYPYLNKEMNLSLGCYGCRAISDLDESMMFMGIPRQMMPTVMEGLSFLGKKAIPDARSKIYLPPMV